MYAKHSRKERKQNYKSGRKNVSTFSLQTNNVLEFHHKNSTIKTKELIKPCTNNQHKFVQSMKKNKYTFGVGMAGCGKTLLALYQGICEINNPNSMVEKIYYVRANIDGCDEEVEIGSMPGELGEKVSHLAMPIYDNCREFMNDSDAKALFDFGKIEVLPLIYLRGRSFANSFVIVDEAQNLSKGKVRTALSRLSHDSKMVLIGDPNQCDLRNDERAFLRASQILHNDEDIGCVYFDASDCLRNDSIGRILEKLNKSF